MKQSIVKFLRDEEGAAGIEYALIAVMVAVVLTLFTTDIKGGVNAIFSAIANAIKVPA